MSNLAAARGKFDKGEELDGDEIVPFFDSLLAEPDKSEIAATLRSWEHRGISENELFGLAALMRSRCDRIVSRHGRFVDLVGTGGSRVKTFNVSTAAALVVAGAGIAVAKHGNRAASSNTGSADVLTELGVGATSGRETAERCLNEIGICFMFAPYFHRLSPVLAEVRRSLGHPTIFNILGPLCNPAGATHHLIGVWDAGLVDVVARVMARLGTERSWVVHGTDGLDEITLSGETDVAEITDGRVKRFQVSPEVFGAKVSSTLHLRAATPAASAEYVRNVLYKNDGDTTASDLVKTSAAAAIHIVNGDSFERAFSAAGESIDSGAAAAKLRDLVRMTNQ